MIERLLVLSNEGLGVPAVETRLEENGGVAARPEVDGPLDLGVAVGCFAVRLLFRALIHATSQLAAVGGIGTSIMLNVTAALDGSADIDEGVAVHLERPVARGRGDRRRGAAQGASKLLHVGTAGGNWGGGDIGHLGHHGCGHVNSNGRGDGAASACWRRSCRTGLAPRVRGGGRWLGSSAGSSYGTLDAAAGDGETGEADLGRLDDAGTRDRGLD